MNKKSKIQNHKSEIANRRESGIATIMAIGLSAMLLVLGVAFVTTSIIEKKASDNYQAISTARSAARTALDRALLVMKDAPMNIDLSKLVSHQTTPAITSAEMQELKEVLDKTIIDDLPTADSSYSFPTVPWNTSNSGLVTWVYLKSNYSDTNLAERAYLSRMAFVVKADTGKLDISAVLDSGMNAGSTKVIPSELISRNATQITSIDSLGVNDTGRPGRNPSEIFLNSIQNTTSPSTWFGNDTIRIMGVYGGSSPDTYAKLPPGKRWGSFDNIFNKIETVAGYSLSSTAKNNFKQVFSVYEPKASEAFWIDFTPDTYKFSNELYHRFNLARNNWDSVTVKGMTEDTDDEVYLYSSNTVNSSNAIPWVSYWSDIGGMGSVVSARNQIIANLIDYCDSDTKATSDYYNTPSVNPPTYVGLERCPYINEVKVVMMGVITQSGSSGSFIYNFRVVPTIYVELVDMYGISNTLSRVYVDSMKVTYDWGTTTYANTVDTSVAIPYFTSVSSTPSKSYTSISFSSPQGLISNQTQASLLGVANVSTLRIRAKINSFRLRLMGSDNTSLYDYSILPDTTSSQDFWTSSSGTTTKTSYLTFNYGVSDPRQNLLPSDWNTKFKVGTTELLSDCGTWISPFTNNAFITARGSFSGTDTDQESSNDPWGISTAYIRNAPMKSPWELGFIHRAKAFQTINLKKYNTTSGRLASKGGGTYSQGDANILDQVKMSTDTQRYGAMNINSKCDTALAALFEYISIGSPQANPGTPAIVIGNNDAKILAKTLTDTSSIFDTRASILTYPLIINNFTNTLVQTTDSTREELIGKFINLTEASPGNVYYIIAVGQAIKDVKGAPVSGGTAKYQEYVQGVDLVLATQKILAVVRRDPITNEFKIIKLEYLSD